MGDSLNENCINFCPSSLVCQWRTCCDAGPFRTGHLHCSSERFPDLADGCNAKKHVPVSLLADETGAQYRLESTPIQVKTQTTGSKFARCLFADCIGIEDRSSVAVQLVDVKSKQIVWAYTVHKQRGGAMNDQSMAEAIAKHLREFMQKHPLN